MYWMNKIDLNWIEQNWIEECVASWSLINFR